MGANIRRMARSAGPLLVVAIVLAGFGVVFASQAAHGAFPLTADSAATATASPFGTLTPAPGDTSIAQATTTRTPATKGSRATATPVGGINATALPTPVIFHVESVTVTPDPSDNFTHTCSAMVYEPMTLTITVDPLSSGETVTYDWNDLYANGAAFHTGTLIFAPGETSKSVQFQQGFNAGRGDGSPQPVNVGVTYPDSWYWAPPTYNNATVAFTCVRQLTNLALTPSISSWNAPCGSSTPVTMTWTVTASPGPRSFATFSPATQSNPSFDVWLAPNSWGAILPATTGPDDQTSQASGTITTGLNTGQPNGTYWMQVATTAPTSLTAQATVVKSC